MQIPIVLYVFLSRAAFSVPLPLPHPAGLGEFLGTVAKCFANCGMGSPTASEQALVAAEEGLLPEIAGYLSRNAVQPPVFWNPKVQEALQGQTIRQGELHSSSSLKRPIWDWELPAESPKGNVAPSPANPMPSNLDPPTVSFENEEVIPTMFDRGPKDGPESLFLNQVPAPIDTETSQPLGLPSRTQFIPAGSKLPIASEQIGEWVPNPNFRKPGHEGEGVMIMMNAQGKLMSTGRISERLGANRAS